MSEVISLGAFFWQELRTFARMQRLAAADDGAVQSVACMLTRKVPADWQATRLLLLRSRCEQAGFGQAA